MQRHIFLTGPTGVGKSKLLRECLGPILCQAGGFITNAEYGAYRELVGFSLSPAASAGGVEGCSSECFLDCSRFPPHTNNEVYRSTGVRLLQEAVWYPYAVLDEFGGFELIIPQFRSALFELLRSSQPVVGVLKTREESSAMRRALGLGAKTDAYDSELRKFLEQDENSLVLPLSDSENIHVRNLLKTWVREYLA